MSIASLPFVVDAIFRLAAALPPSDRPKFEAEASAAIDQLPPDLVGPGSVDRILRPIWRARFSPPNLDEDRLGRWAQNRARESKLIEYDDEGRPHRRSYQLASQGPGKIRLDGQEIRVSWHRSLPLRVFVCPKCGRERYKLSCVGGEWGCRGCHRLDYQCRHRCRSIKGYWLVRQLRRRIGASPELGSPLPMKPLYARKHWAICLQIRELEKRLRLHADEDVSGVLEQRYERRRS